MKKSSQLVRGKQFQRKSREGAKLTLALTATIFLSIHLILVWLVREGLTFWPGEGVINFIQKAALIASVIAIGLAVGVNIDLRRITARWGKGASPSGGEEEQKNILARLKQLEAKCQFFFEESQTVNLIIGIDGTIKHSNRSFANLFDEDQENIAGRDPLDFIVPEHKDSFSNYRDQHLEGRFTPRLEVDLLGVRGRRTILWGEHHVSLLEDYGPKGILISGVDITTLKQIEKRGNELRKRLLRASQMESLGLLAGGVAHDLKNIFSPLIGYPDHILNQLPPDSPLQKPLQKIKDSALRSSEVIQNFLALARRGRYERGPLNVNEVVQTFLQSMEFRELHRRYSEVKITLDLEQNLPSIRGSHAQMLNVIMNLVRNAFEATPGGGSVAIVTSRRFLDYPLRGYQQIPRGDYIVIAIRDEGKGIEKQDMAKLFDPFYSRKKMGRSGSGLGLAVVAGVVEDRRGYLDLESEIGKGTTFFVYLPILEKKEVKLEWSVSGSELALVLDNNEEDRERAGRLLSEMGYQVATFGIGEELINYAQEKPAEIILLDMGLENGVYGLDVYRQILRFNPQQKAIIVSGSLDPASYMEEAARLGVNQYLAKPLTREKLSQALSEELGQMVREELDRSDEQY